MSLLELAILIPVGLLTVGLIFGCFLALFVLWDMITDKTQD